MDKWLVLEKELNLISDDLIREWTKQSLNNTPNYFFEAPASSTGKYHPTCTIKKGGLVTHIKRAVYIANRLCEGWAIFAKERDIVISAVILHDIAKVGNPEVARSTYEDYENHPINAEKYFAKIQSSEETFAEACELSETTKVINDCIRYHMGRWSPKSIAKEIKNYSLLELIVYTADYMATTKDLITPKDNE